MELVLIIHNVRSAHNVGSLLRSADAFAAQKVYMTGFTPYPALPKDTRLPHIAARATREITKTSLGAEKSLAWQNAEDTLVLLEQLRKSGYVIAAVEQSKKSSPLPSYLTAAKTALIVGHEVDGLEQSILDKADVHLEIPMLGQKESLNVAVAGAVAMYHLRFRHKKDGHSQKT